MPRNVILAADLPASAERLFEMYLDASIHADFTGAPVTVGPVVGTEFSAFEGMLSGKMLHVEPKRMIVQTWRSANWPADALDSVLTLTFWPLTESTARVELVHLNIPEDDFAGVSHGWEKFYWQPWRAYLERG